MNKVYLGVLIATAVVLGGVDDASAAESAGAFHPETPADAAHIFNNGNYLYNASASSSATVVADLGTGTGPMSLTVYGWTQGNLTYSSCSIFYTSLTDSTNRGNSSTPGRGGQVGSWDLATPGPKSMSVSSGTPPWGPTYAYQLVCTLGALKPGLSGEQLFGWD